jgi:hypothetical protein
MASVSLEINFFSVGVLSFALALKFEHWSSSEVT